MLNMQVTGGCFIALGAYLQQFALYRKRMQSLVLPHKDCSSNRPTLLVMFLCGLGLELGGFVYCSMSTYVLLTSLHLVFFKLNFVNDENRHYSRKEWLGSLLVVVGAVVVVLAGGNQLGIVQQSQYDSVFNWKYFIWMVGSLLMNSSMRKLGFYKGRILLETCLPAQIATFGYASIKIAFYSIEMYFSGFSFSVLLFVCCLIISVVSLCSTGSFLSALWKHYDFVVILGAYYLWILCYTLSLAIFVVNAGVTYEYSNFIAIFFSVVSIGLGVYLHVKQRLDDLESKNYFTNEFSDELQALNPSSKFIVIEEDPLIKNSKNL